MAGRPLVQVDESAPLRPDSPVLYCSTKARAEQAVLAASGEGMETVVVRPRFVWGRGDTTLLPEMVDMVRAGRFAWIGGGRHLTSITHVENVVEGLILGAARGRPGQRLLRHRRRAGRVPRVRRPAAGHPGRLRSLAQHPRSGGGRARDRRRGRLARPAAPRPPSADPLRLLGLLAGVHAANRQGPLRAGLRAAGEHRRRPGGAERLARAGSVRGVVVALGDDRRRRLRARATRAPSAREHRAAGGLDGREAANPSGAPTSS